MGDKPALVPRLRFPEFREAGAWESRALGDKDVANFVKKRVSVDELSLDSYVSTENILPDFGGKKCASKLPPSGSFTNYRQEDVLIANIRPYLKKVWVANKNGAASNDVIVVRPMNGVKPSFLSALLRNESFIDYIMQGAKGVKMPRGDISLMKKYPLAIPSHEEQQKIADCLSSLDELISAQSEKIDALKTYKKGLMQQLFPREGETIPQLRFPEFRGAGEWTPKLLGGLCDNISSGKDKSDPRGTYNLYGSTGIIGKAASDTYSGVYILVARVGANAGSLTKTEGVFGVTDNTLVLHLKNPEMVDFIYYWLDKTGLNKLVFGSGQPLVTGKQLKELELCFPSQKEQKRIGDCLSSLDALIAAHIEKLCTLKAHKKGLMQQLFPSPETIGV
jgi:type I restriction enzyme, S subunit